MKKIEAENIRPWGSGESTEFLPKELSGTFKFEVKWSGISKPKDDGKSTVSCAIDLFEGSKKVGKFWADAFALGKETAKGVKFAEKGIIDVKDGKITSVKEEEED